MAQLHDRCDDDDDNDNDDIFFPKSSVYEIILQKKYSSVRQAIDEDTIRRKRFACWITKTTNTHSEYVTLFFHYNRSCTNAPQYYVIRHWLSS